MSLQTLASPFTKERNTFPIHLVGLFLFEKVITNSLILVGGTCLSWALLESQASLRLFGIGKNRSSKTQLGDSSRSVDFY